MLCLHLPHVYVVFADLFNDGDLGKIIISLWSAALHTSTLLGFHITPCTARTFWAVGTGNDKCCSIIYLFRSTARLPPTADMACCRTVGLLVGQPCQLGGGSGSLPSCTWHPGIVCGLVFNVYWDGCGGDYCQRASFCPHRSLCTYGRGCCCYCVHLFLVGTFSFPSSHPNFAFVSR